MDPLGEEVKVLPYKFCLLATKEELEQSLVWSLVLKSWQKDPPEPDARYGAAQKEDRTRVFRLDIDSSYFRPDGTHWKRSSVRKKIKKLFKNLPPLIPANLTLVLVWTDDSSWLSLQKIRENMEVWEDGRGEEPRALWESVRSTGRWKD